MKSPPNIWVSFHIGPKDTEYARNAARTYEERASQFGHRPQDEDVLPEHFAIQLEGLDFSNAAEVTEAVSELVGPEAYWLVVRDSALVRKKLQASGRNWFDTSAGVFIRLPSPSPREIERVVNELRGHTGPPLYWIEVPITQKQEEGQLAESDKVDIRLRAAGHGSTRINDSEFGYGRLVGLTKHVGEDPEGEASHMIRVVRGEANAIPLPEPLSALVQEWTRDGEPEQGYDALQAICLASPNDVDLVSLYATSLMSVRYNLFPDMSMLDILIWLVDHWKLGDDGCAAALRSRARRKQPKIESETPQWALRWQPEPGRDGVAAQSSMLADGSKVTLVHSESTGQTALFHGQEAVATGSNQSMLARASKLAERARSGGQR